MGGWHIGIIGGSGLYDIPGITEPQSYLVDGPFGAPSDTIFSGRIGEVRVSFLARHGRGHRIPPGEINFRANVDALKRLGCTDLLSVSSVGSLAEERPPGSFTIVDQFIDRTRGRVESFFGSGLVAHVSMADPVCPRLSAMAMAAAAQAGAAVHPRGTYLAMEGPQFSSPRRKPASTAAGAAHVIGMTAMPEARLAREAELPYALVGMVTDYDCWREGEAVDVAEVIAQLGKNADKARAMVGHLLAALPAEREASPIDTNLDHRDHHRRSPALRRRGR